MSFITPLITTIQNVSTEWYYSVYKDKRYNSLTKTLDIPEPIEALVMYLDNDNNIPREARDNYMYYDTYNDTSCSWFDNNNTYVLKDCISEGDGTPAQLEDFNCSDHMERYRQSVPAFTYNAAVFPPYGDTIHHWYITTVAPYRHVSLITDSKEEILYCINNALHIELHFVPLPDTQQ